MRIGVRSRSPYVAEQVRRIADAAGAVVVDGEPCDVWVVDSGGQDETSRPGSYAVRLLERGLAPPAGPGQSSEQGTVLELPGEAEALLRYLGTAKTTPRARTIAFVGARGGAGASTLAAALAREAVRAGTCTALADLDDASAGLDLLLGIEHEPGPRWTDLRAERAGFPPDALSMALPRWEAVRVLSGDGRGGARGDDPALPDALLALASGHDLLVLDLPRNGQWGIDFVRLGCPLAVEVVVVVALCDVRSAAAATLAGEALAGKDVRLVVRAPGPGGIYPEAFAAACGLPLAAVTRTERGGAAAAERGEAPGDHRRGSVARTASRLAVDLGLGT